MNKTALITGASGGIGLELADIFAREGFDLWLVSRNAASLEDVRKKLTAQYPLTVQTLPADLSDPSAARRIFEELQKRSVHVDVLVNNAGAGTFSMFAEESLSSHERIMNLNMVSLTQLTRLFLDPMLRKKSGRILNVASTAAFQPGPGMAVYYASKAYVLHLSEALSDELRGSGVTVTALCPGPTRTGFQKNAGMERSKLFRHAVMDARAVAELGYRGSMAGKRLVITGFQNNVLVRISRLAPRGLVLRFVRKFQEKEERRPHE